MGNRSGRNRYSGALCMGALAFTLLVTACSGGGGGGGNQQTQTAPAITAQPQNQAVTAPATATFSVACTGNPVPTYQWSLGGTAISGATAASFTTAATTVAMSGGSYTVTVTNSAGNVTSNAAILTVNSPTPTAPTITAQPQSQTVTAPATATFSVTATGIPAPTYQWYLGGSAISGATAASYTTPATTVAMSGGSYTVTVTNTAGNVHSDAAVLTVNGPTPTAPTITAQPQGQTVTAPAPATFAVTATGTPAPTYQWKLGGTAISGATSASYATLATTVAMSGGSYTVTVTNSAGNVTSTPAILTVNPPAGSTDTQGIFTGTMHSTNWGDLTVIGTAISTGEVHLVTSVPSNPAAGGYPFSASVSISNGSGSGTLFAGIGNITTSLTMSSVTVIAGTSATGSYVSGTGDSGTFSYTYNSLYTRPKALASLGGSYSSTAISSGVAESFTLDNAGNISGTTLTGAFTGTLVLLDPAKNLYRVTMHYSTGTYSGLGFWSDTASGTLAANSLYILVANGTLYGLSAAFVKN